MSNITITDVDEHDCTLALSVVSISLMISLTIAGIIAYLHCREPAQMYPTSVRESMCVRTHLLKETGFKEYT